MKMYNFIKLLMLKYKISLILVVLMHKNYIVIF